MTKIMPKIYMNFLPNRENTMTAIQHSCPVDRVRSVSHIVQTEETEAQRRWVYNEAERQTL